MASPAYELSTDANGNTVLVPATTKPQKPKGFLDDVASKAREYFLPRGSDFTEGTAATYGAGKDITRRGYENLKTNPLYGAGQVIGGSALSAISPLAGATEFVTKPVGRTLGPAPEHAAEIASMFTPLPSKGASMFKPRPKAAPVTEFANIPKEWSVMPDQWKEYVNALPANQRQEIFRTLNEASISPAEAVVLENKYPSFTNAPSSSNVAAPAARSAPSAASEAVETARSISPVEMAVKQSKYPGRFLHPETGQAQSVFDPLLGQNRPAMGAVHDPFEALAQRVSEMPGPVDYLTKRQPVVNPDTGYVLRVQEQGPNWGKNREGALGEFTPGQRVAQAGVAGAVGVPIAMMANNEANRREEQNIRDQFDQSASNQFTPEQALRIASARPDFNQSAPNTFSQQDAIKLASMRPEFNQSSPNTFNADQAAKIARQRMAASAPMPPTRPAELAREQPSILSKIFSGQDYQSKGGQLRQDGKINWGDPESAADFFRADKARMETPEASGMKRGGAANAKPDSMHKALEIIHHLLTRSH